MRNKSQPKSEALPDVIAPGLKVLFCGINPSLVSAELGHHFAGRSNRFWKALNRGGFTDSELEPGADRTLLEHGYGITNIVARATGKADELDAAELTTGVQLLEKKVRRFKPTIVAFVGLDCYRRAFDRSRAVIGLQDQHRIGDAAVWLLPNTSGLVRQYPPKVMARLFAELHVAVERM